MRTLVLLILPFILFGQKRSMTSETYSTWNKIQNSQLSNDGSWASYRLTNEGDRSDLYFYNIAENKEYVFQNSSKANFDYNSKFCAFLSSSHPDTIKNLKLKKVAEKDFPKDTLVIFDLINRSIDKIPNVSSFKLPKKYAGLLAYKTEAAKDTTESKRKQTKRKKKKKNKAEASPLVVKNFNTAITSNFDLVFDYEWSDKNGQLALYGKANDSTSIHKIELLDATSNKQYLIMEPSGECKHLVFNETGDQLAFTTNRDTTKKEIKPFELFIWNSKSKKSSKINLENRSKKFQLSEHKEPYFLKYQDKLIYGIAPIPQLPDSTILEDEKVNVEIWHYKDQLLHTQQNVNKEKDLKKSYLCSYNLKSKTSIQINDENNSELSINTKLKGKNVLSYNNKEYQQYISWLGHDFKDVYLTDITTGQKRTIAKKIDGFPRLAPTEDFVYWYSRIDTAWMSYNIQNQKTQKITERGFYDELNDRPMNPYPSGSAMCLDDQSILIYDHFDIWKIDANAKKTPINLTNGRADLVKYRFINLDKEKTFLPADTTILVHHFDEKDKSSGYAFLNLKTQEIQQVSKEEFRFSTRPIKAKDSDDIIYSKQSYELFPDLIHSTLSFEKSTTISKANPQQSEYAWGSIEPFFWSDHLDQKLEGLLVKPEGFNPKKKYPLIVNFYEKSSDRLHYHRAPYAHRSTINYTYYANKGYVILNVDIHYYDGYPGESCYLAIMNAVDQLLAQGFIDESRMGLQGHSWGGYQIAHLLTKTNRFKCAESGAPVVNMTSAYGGIRWRTGMSRMFQYEKTQSRIGATLWERPDLYIANSPVFNLDKVETPVLILHNDKDGAVPWYQGIEYFVGLRRLGKPSWLLNYNNEPHWPVKKQNRIDFNIRMEQFFDHYLMDKEMPIWMKEGIPAVKKGIDSGLELHQER